MKHILKLANTAICCLLFVFFTQNGYAQEEKFTEKVWRINFLTPGVELEVPVTNNSTFLSSLSSGFWFLYSYNSAYEIKSSFTYGINLALGAEYRYYYNFEKRREKEKRIDNNSANFISASFTIPTTDIIGNTSDVDNFGVSFVLKPAWGFQRLYGKSFHLLFDVGPAIGISSKGKVFFQYVPVGFQLGFDL